MLAVMTIECILNLNRISNKSVWTLGPRYKISLSDNPELDEADPSKTTLNLVVILDYFIV